MQGAYRVQLFGVQLFGQREASYHTRCKRRALRDLRSGVFGQEIRRGTVWANNGKRWYRLASIAPDLKGERGVRVTWHRPEMAVSF